MKRALRNSKEFEREFTEFQKDKEVPASQHQFRRHNCNFDRPKRIPLEDLGSCGTNRPPQPLARVPKPLASVVMFATGVSPLAASAGVPMAVALSAAEVLRSVSAAKQVEASRVRRFAGRLLPEIAALKVF